jgi:uncharacterized pyridoxal phosphate-containing UPF0001 family protein
MFGLDIIGLMTMPPLVQNAEKSRQHFRSLRVLKEWLNKRFGAEILKELSMGTSVDYPVAIEEGSTIVRIGRAIMGERKTE